MTWRDRTSSCGETCNSMESCIATLYTFLCTLAILLPSLPTSQEVAKGALLDGLDNIIPWFHPEVSRQYCPSQEANRALTDGLDKTHKFCKWEMLKG
ncbi:LOW QUALITY PROTEIN: hypothetical protein TorRG33x02_307480 [Trema orientale]|uniref:Uncharacterized protein n=1 Tax=Trema orientale TaxID=63057 RepID=A0A2P5BV82_TREOI|nr:LOW QUALITY PROTEIN: hypothetical protein TorRG33x02_307480 [Trema orientale]